MTDTMTLEILSSSTNLVLSYTHLVHKQIMLESCILLEWDGMKKTVQLEKYATQLEQMHSVYSMIIYVVTGKHTARET